MRDLRLHRATPVMPAPPARGPGATPRRSRILRRVVTVLATFACALGGSLATAPAAVAGTPAFSVGAVTNNCGIVTCSVYISRSGTRSMDQFLDGKVAQWGSWGAETATCGAFGLVPYVGVPLGIYCGFRFKQFDVVLDDAAVGNKCFKVTYTRPVGTVAGAVTHISTNNGSYCRN